MKITRNVITDLLPVYFSEEVSEDTRALVEAYFRQDPEFKQMALQGQTQLEVLGASASNPAAQREKEALIRVKKVLHLRSTLLGVALFCSLMPFSLAGNSQQGITWIMIRDLPHLAVIFAVVAVLAWGAYFWTFRSMRDI